VWISDLMSSPAITVPPELPVKEAARLLRDRDVAAVPVVDAAGTLVGVVSEIDLLRGTMVPDPVAHLVPVDVPGPPPSTVADVMTRQVESLAPHTDLYDAARRMASTRVRSMPVVDGEAVVGVVSRADLLRALARDDQDISVEVGQRLTEYFGAELPCAVEVDRGLVTLRTDRDGQDEDVQAAVLLSQRVRGVVRVLVEKA
jgi:CBS domain-containing protein